MLRSMTGKSGWLVPLLCVLVFAQALVVAIPHAHHESPGHSCQLCHFSSGFVTEPALNVAAASPAAGNFTPSTGATDATLDPCLRRQSSRAPPA